MSDSRPVARSSSARAQAHSASEHPSVCVVIAARNAEGTIARAVASTLSQPEVGEVIVVDDASDDRTAEAAKDAGALDARVAIIRCTVNRGPSAARNLAIRESSLPLISVLDADDFLLPFRFARLVQHQGWDLIADNIAFIAEHGSSDFNSKQIPDIPAGFAWLDLPTFVIRNISRRSMPRGELGFLKPVIRRAFLDEQNLRYDEQLRLGEDFNLYVRMLARGARFAVSKECGYVAVERSNSLSARHSAADLAALAAADEAILKSFELDRPGVEALRRHHRHIRGKWAHRAFLHKKQRHGLLVALASSLHAPRDLLEAFRGIVADKVQKVRSHGAPKDVPPRQRFLFPPDTDLSGA